MFAFSPFSLPTLKPSIMVSVACCLSLFALTGFLVYGEGNLGEVARPWSALCQGQAHKNQQSVSRLVAEARSLNEAGRFSDARPLFLKAIELGDKLNDQRLTSAGIMLQLAFACEHQGNDAESEVLLKKAIQCRSASLRKDIVDAEIV
jgi:hypothetical protein